MFNRSPVGALTLALFLSSMLSGQEQAKDTLEHRVRSLFEATLRGSVTEREAAREKLAELHERSWGPLYDLYVKTDDARLQRMLRYQLGIARAQECEIILKGTVSKVRHLQGGVIDHHDLLVEFEKGTVEVLKGRDFAKEQMPTATTLRIAQGTHRDTWLCELMKKEILRQPRAGIWLLKMRTLSYPYGTGKTNTAFRHFEFLHLPAEALRASEDLTGNCVKRSDR